MEQITVRILGDDTRAPLYKMYPQQTRPQPAYIEISEDGDLAANYSGEIGNAVPASVWHQRDLRISIPPGAAREAIQGFVADNVDLFRRVIAGHSVEWDGSNHVGRLTDDARDALETLERKAESIESIAVWTAADWIAEGFSLAEFVEKGARAYGDECADAAEPDAVIDGDCAEAAARLASERVLRHIAREHQDDPTMRRAAELLAAYDPDEYAGLLSDYRAEFGA
jgi:hypothetical protein